MGRFPPDETYPRLTAVKVKTSYLCGEALTLDDLTVTYYTEAGKGSSITDFTTNAASLDMSVPGQKQLEITYNGLKTQITITVRQNTENPSVKTYKVTFNLQGKGAALGEYTSDTYQKAAEHSRIPKPTDPQAEGYTFTGWYKEAACTSLWDFSKDTIENDLTLYAGWKENVTTCTVTFDLRGKGSPLPEYTGADYKNLPKGSLIKKPADPTDKNYTFTGWYKETACTTLWDFGKDTIENDLTLYAGWAKADGDILPGDMPSGGKIPEGIWTAFAKSAAYTGRAIKPAVRVYDGKERLIEGVDYTVKCKNNTKVSTASGTKAPTITITGKGVYKKQSIPAQHFAIMPVDLKDVTADDIAVVYNKKIQKKVPTVSWSGKKLAKNKDFTISWPDSGNEAYREPGTYSIILNAKTGGNFTGTRTVKITITDPKSLTLLQKVKVGKIPSRLYTGSPAELKKNSLKVTLKKAGLTEGKDYRILSYENNVDVGTATAVLQGMGNYAGTKRVAFKITAYDLKKDPERKLEGLKEKIEVSLGEKTTARPRVQLTLGGQKLVEGKDYTISYKNNKRAGSEGAKKAPTIVIKGKGNFKGTIHKKFTITQ